MARQPNGPCARSAADYFACGTLVVWDVDLRSETVIKPYRAGDPDNPLTFKQGETARGTSSTGLAVDALFG